MEGGRGGGREYVCGVCGWAFCKGGEGRGGKEQRGKVSCELN